MGDTFQVPETVIESVVAQMRDSGIVHPEATFNRYADGGLREEVAYRDLDFLERVGGPEHEEVIVDAALSYLKERGIVPMSAGYDKAALAVLRSHVAEKFTRRDWTTITPVMERMLFMITSVKQPSTMIELGCFWGNTLVWFAGPCLGPAPSFAPREVCGIDVNPLAIEMARENFEDIATPPGFEIMCEDGRQTLARFEGPIDLLYIEASFRGQKGPLYLPLLEQAYEKLPKGSWVIAHDPTWWKGRRAMQDYLAFVRDPRYFSESITFDIDMCGLELTIR